MDGLKEFFFGLIESKSSKGKKAYIMYHGTTLEAANNIIQNGFVPSSGGMLGPGVYVSRCFQKASAYPRHLLPGQQKVVLKLNVHVGKVKRINCQGHPLQYTWHQEGYDTAWVPPNCGMVPSGLEEDCVWDPNNIEVLDILDSNGQSLTSQGFMPVPCGIPYPMPYPGLVPPVFGPLLPPIIDRGLHPRIGLPHPMYRYYPFGVPYPPLMRPPF